MVHLGIENCIKNFVADFIQDLIAQQRVVIFFLGWIDLHLSHFGHLVDFFETIY